MDVKMRTMYRRLNAVLDGILHVQSERLPGRSGLFLLVLDMLLSVTACCHAIRDMFVRFYVPRCTFTRTYVEQLGYGVDIRLVGGVAGASCRDRRSGGGLGISDFETLMDSSVRAST